MMGTLARFVISSILILLGAITVYSQMPGTRNVPRTIQNCYKNATAYNRYMRQPMHINNFISIVRKIEKKLYQQWDIRRIARTLLKKYQFDGIEFHPYVHEDLAFSPGEEEAHKTAILHSLIPEGHEDFPESLIDNDEICGLHWMLSHSMNSTLRDDELPPAFRSTRGRRSYNPNGQNYGERRDREQLAKQMSPSSKQPIETGVVFSRWGPVSLGRVLAGITAGLEPSVLPIGSAISNGGNSGSGGNGGSWPNGNGGSWPNGNGGNGNNGGGSWPNGGSGGTGGFIPPTSNDPWGQNNNQYGRKKRQAYQTFSPLQNIHAATVAGDVGQAAILNAPYNEPNQRPPPSGKWNDTVCPREFTQDFINTDQNLRIHTWTYMTAAELRGGVDGLILGKKILEWDRIKNLALSDVFDQYYSEKGITGEPRYRACNRANIFREFSIDVSDQAKSFAYLYNNKTNAWPHMSTDLLFQNVEKAQSKMDGFVGSLMQQDAETCKRPESSQNVQEQNKFTEPQSTVYAVLDHSVTTHADMEQQLKFIGQLGNELEINPWGSRLGVVNGGSGLILVNPNATDNQAVAACNVMKQANIIGQRQEVARVLGQLKSEFQKLRDEAERYEHNGVSNGITILFMVQGNKLDEGQKSEIMRLTKEYQNEFGDVHIMYTSSKYSAGDFAGFTLQPEYDFIRLPSPNNISNDADEFMKEYRRRSHGILMYPKCNKHRHDQDSEHKLYSDFYVTPGSIQYYRISPDYFYSGKNLRMRFSSHNGKVRVCYSRTNRYPNSDNISGSTVRCAETSGSYVAPGGAQADLEIGWDKPCGKNGKRDGCEPIYISFTPVVFPGQGVIGLNCLEENCRYGDQVRVSFSHWDMRCNGGGISLLFSPLLILASFLFTFTLRWN